MKRLKDGVLEDLTADEITAREAQEVTASTALELALSEIREKRNILIAETDYLALSDHTLSSDMTTYRQSLRDITNGLDTVEKCENVTWPTKP